MLHENEAKRTGKSYMLKLKMKWNVYIRINFEEIKGLYVQSIREWK